MTIRTLFIRTSLIAASLASGAAHAVLQGRDLNGSVGSFEAYYDTVLDITWLANANYALEDGYIFTLDGRMTWYNATAWAAHLSFTDGANTYDNWRLPTVGPINGTNFNFATSTNGSTDRGYNISEQGTAYAGSTASEMAHLFYNTLNNKSLCDPAASTASICSGPQEGHGLTNTGPFTNFQVDGQYWSATTYESNTSYAMDFEFDIGYQSISYKPAGRYALAVSPGDVGAVPEANTWAMFLVGLGAVGVAVKRRRG